ncbi:YncE family protein [bacterium]|nr:YncE family protein [bacterium]
MQHHRIVWLGLALTLGLSGCSLFGSPVSSNDRPSLLAYASMPADNAVAVVSVTDKRPIGSIQVGQAPVKLAINPRPDLEYLYTANENDGTVSFVDLRSGKQVQALQAGSRPTGVAVTPPEKDPSTTARDQNRQYVYVTSYGDRTFTRLNAQTNAVTKTFTPPSTTFMPRGVVTHPMTKTFASANLAAYVFSDTPATSSTGCEIVKINPDGSLGSALTIPGSVKLWRGAISPDGKRLYLTDRGASQLWKVNLENYTFDSSVALNGNGYDIAIAEDGKMAYVTLPEAADKAGRPNGLVQVINLETNAKSTVQVNDRVADATQPQAIAVNSAGTELWVSLQNRLGYFGMVSGQFTAGSDRLSTVPYTSTPGQAPPISDIVLGAGVQ